MLIFLCRMNETIPLNRRQSVYITLYLYYLLYVTLQIMEEEIRITKNRWTSGDSLLMLRTLFYRTRSSHFYASHSINGESTSPVDLLFIIQPSNRIPKYTWFTRSVSAYISTFNFSRSKMCIRDSFYKPQKRGWMNRQTHFPIVLHNLSWYRPTPN